MVAVTRTSVIFLMTNQKLLWFQIGSAAVVPYRTSASGLLGKSSLVLDCNAVKGSRQIGRVTWEDAMAPKAGSAKAVLIMR
jgi:hypothetical protein